MNHRVSEYFSAVARLGHWDHEAVAEIRSHVIYSSNIRGVGLARIGAIAAGLIFIGACVDQQQCARDCICNIVVRVRSWRP